MRRSTEHPVDAAIAGILPDVLVRLNDDFEDAVLLVGRVLGGRPAATAARVTDVDRLGLDAIVIDPDGAHSRRVAFAAELAEPNDLSAAFTELVSRARSLSGEEGLTSAERETQMLAATRTMLTTVRRVEAVHAHLRRITFGGGDLATFAPLGPDTFLYVLLPPAGQSELTVDRSFTWDAYGKMPEPERPLGAYYTLREWRPEASEIDMLFVLHGDEGPASRWAARARPGDPVGLWGPRSAYEPPAQTDWYLLVADETGLPAVASILESLPEGAVARVFAEVADANEHQPLPSSPTFDITWLHRDGAPAGTTDLLSDSVRAMQWPTGKPYVWGGGESHAMTAVRKCVRHELGLPREAVSLMAYWRRA
jgi:NADPH-dependent ferric siderophore reductase